MGTIFNVRTLILLAILIAAGYLVSNFPDESVLIIGVAVIIVIGIWLQQAYGGGSTRGQ